MTRTVYLFEDGTALVDGIEADATGARDDLPFATDAVRVAAARAALAEDDWEAAEAASARGVVSPTDEEQVQVSFVAPPDWSAHGTALWEPTAGTAHAVFTSTVMMVDGVAVTDCVGLPFADGAARRDCAAWCLANGLEEIALRVSRTPVGGPGPHCTWPAADLGDEAPQDETPMEVPPTEKVPDVADPGDEPPEALAAEPKEPVGNVVPLFGCVVGEWDI